MNTILTLEDADHALKQFIPRTDKKERYTLERMRTLMRLLGDPQNQLRVIHVAGTSGKTSTSYYLAGLLRDRGYTVGLSVSPHIDAVSERAQINLSPLAEAEYCRELSVFLATIQDFDIRPTYFEVLVAFAFWLFAKRQVDYAVIEVGLGGLLDGTNVIDRADKVCVVTDIGLDHTEILGDTIEQIAAQKAGIIQDDNAVYMLSQSPEVEAVVRRQADQHHAQLHIQSAQPPSDQTFLDRNLSLATTVVNALLQLDDRPQLTPEQASSVSKMQIPGRMETVAYQGKKVILDGAHNAQKIRALVRSLQLQTPNENMTMLVSFASTKSTYLDECLTELRKLGDTVVVTEFNLGQDVPRKPIPSQELADACNKAGFKHVSIESDPLTAIRQARETQASTILVTGSLYLIGQVRQSFRKVDHTPKRLDFSSVV